MYAEYLACTCFDALLEEKRMQLNLEQNARVAVVYPEELLQLQESTSKDSEYTNESNHTTQERSSHFKEQQCTRDNEIKSEVTKEERQTKESQQIKVKRKLKLRRQ